MKKITQMAQKTEERIRGWVIKMTHEDSYMQSDGDFTDKLNEAHIFNTKATTAMYKTESLPVTRSTKIIKEGE